MVVFQDLLGKKWSNKFIRIHDDQCRTYIREDDVVLVSQFDVGDDFCFIQNIHRDHVIPPYD